MQVKILNKIKEIIVKIGTTEEKNSTLESVKTYIEQLISTQLIKINESQKGLKAKEDKKAIQPKKDKAQDLKSVKAQFGKKRTFADKAEKEEDNEDNAANNRK